MTRQELCAALDAQLAAAQEQVCVLAVPLAGGVPLYERGAGRRAVSASTIKVFILLAALDEVRRGRLALDTPVAVTAEDILPDTGVFVDGPGMHPLEDLTNIPDTSCFRKDLIVTDTVYAPRETVMMKQAKEAGCERIYNGMGMMLFQALIAIELYTGKKTPVDYMKEKLGI